MPRKQIHSITESLVGELKNSVTREWEDFLQFQLEITRFVIHNRQCTTTDCQQGGTAIQLDFWRLELRILFLLTFRARFIISLDTTNVLFQISY